MANITNLLNIIKNNIYGRDIRMAIHDALKAINNDVGDNVIQGVSEWISAHPEAVTTVQDGSLTSAKFSESLKDNTTRRFKGGTTSDFAKTMVANVAMSYVLRKNDFIYGDEHDIFHGEGGQINGKYQMNCSSFVMAVMNGISFENSKYVSNKNTPNHLGFCDQDLIDFFESDKDKAENYWKFSGELAEYLHNRGYCFVPQPDLSDVQTGDVLFYSRVNGGDMTDTSYLRINHSAIFREHDCSAYYTVWEVGTVPDVSRYFYSNANNAPVVLVCRPPYKDCDDELKIVNMQIDDTYSGLSNISIYARETFKAGKVYTIAFDCRYGYDIANSTPYHYPAIVQPNNDLLWNNYGITEIQDHYVLYVTPTVDITDGLILQTRSSQAGLPDTDSWYKNIVVAEGFHPNLKYDETHPPVSRLRFVKGSIFDSVSMSSYNFPGFSIIGVDCRNPSNTLYTDNTYVIGTFTGVVTMLGATPVNCVVTVGDSGSLYSCVGIFNNRNELAFAVRDIPSGSTITGVRMYLILPNSISVTPRFVPIATS